MCIPEMLDRSTSGSLKLDDGMAIVIDFGVDDDLELKTFSFHDPFESLTRRKYPFRNPRTRVRTTQVDPDIVGVEDLELTD